MSVDLAFQPLMLSKMYDGFSNINFSIVSDLEANNTLFVEDGNHGEYRPRAEEFVEDGIPFIRPPDLINGKIDLSLCQKINNVAFNRVRKGIGQGGDIVLTHNATIGRVAITADSDPIFVTNPQTTVWRSKNRNIIDNKYLYYFMCSAGFQQQLDAHKGRNATFDYVSLTQQRTLIIPIIDIQIQKKIAHILSTLDDKIELNRKMNQTLEEMAQAIFKSWFVDFDPVHAKAKCSSEVDCELAAKELGISKEVLDLFPSEFEESELGMIPKGWIAKKFGDLVTPKKGKNITKTKVIEGNVPVVAGGLTPAYYHNQHNVEAPVITVSASGANAGYVNMYNINIWASDCSYINSTNSEYVYTSYVYLKLNQSNITWMQQGAAQPHIYPSHLMRLDIVDAGDVLWSYIENKLAPMFKKIANNEQEILTLQQTRDTLLPKLLSGEIDVSDFNIGNINE